MANGRKNRNFIRNIRQGNALVGDVNKIFRIFAEHFKSHFGQKRDNRIKVDLEKLLAFRGRVDLTHLEQPFSLEEIKCAVFELGSNKAPGPDGFPIHFFRHFWDIIKFDLMHLCEDFFLWAC